MSSRYAVFSKTPALAVTDSARAEIISMSGEDIPGCMYTHAEWYRGELEIPGLFRHESDEVLMFTGSDQSAPEALNAEISLQIENDILTLDRTCAVFIPAGAAHGNIRVKNLSKPVLACFCHTDTDSFSQSPARATAPEGTYTQSYVDRYDTRGLRLPRARDGVMTRLFYLDGSRVPGAPYFESVWFNIPTEAFLEAHSHDLDEVIFFAGADSSRPDELGGRIIFYIDDEPIELDRSCLLFIPAGVKHAPFEILEMKQPCLHFSGGNRSSYRRV